MRNAPWRAVLDWLLVAAVVVAVYLFVPVVAA
jgi:hypothetical protein